MVKERPEILEIERVAGEAEGITSIFFGKKISASPGQFVMVWIPGVDEKPFAVSYLSENSFGITVASVGSFSSKLGGMKAGDKVGVRGPYGTGYTLGKGLKKIVLIGGGYGLGPLALLAEQAKKNSIDTTFIAGTRTKSKLIFEKRLKTTGVKLIVTTDDGSCGIKGKTTDVLPEILKKEKIDKVFACGPEPMLKKVADICAENKISGEVSIERHVKCGFGLCGHCCMDTLGIRACVEGPVMSVDTALKLTEFGNYRRLKSGRKEKFLNLVAKT